MNTQTSISHGMVFHFLGPTTFALLATLSSGWVHHYYYLKLGGNSPSVRWLLVTWCYSTYAVLINSYSFFLWFTHFILFLFYHLVCIILWQRLAGIKFINNLYIIPAIWFFNWVQTQLPIILLRNTSTKYIVYSRNVFLFIF